jgi:hypothetical protein
MNTEITEKISVPNLPGLPMDPVTGIADAVAAIFNFFCTPVGQMLLTEADANFKALVQDIIVKFHIRNLQ